MDKADRILKHREYHINLEKNCEAEAKRCFCHHEMVHFLDVARSGWILNLEQNAGIRKELLYGAALLHDIGKHRQYLEGIPHEIASAEIAEKILRDCGFSEEENSMICDAIRSHRDASVKEEKSLRGILYRADKLSRACFACPAEAECNWTAEKKNLRLEV
ncbi:MAG: HD domain-containing protein [Lachnospiraceae bacterium]|nr:HD domain-containing protein [Lachnospiraceae bacterium]